MIRAILFDMDDTLLDWSKREGNWMEFTLRHLDPLHVYLKQSGHSVPELSGLVDLYMDQSRRAWELIQPPEWNCPRQQDILRDTLRAADLDIGRIDLDEAQRRFAWGPIPGVRLYDDAQEVLSAVRAAGMKTGLITNAAVPMWMRDTELRALGLLESLDVRLTAGDVGKFKPHPHPFRVALERLHILPDEAIFVGDRIQDDVAGAQAAGMQAVWIRRGNSQPDGGLRPDAIIESLAGLFAVLDDWHPAWRKQ